MSARDTHHGQNATRVRQGRSGDDVDPSGQPRARNKPMANGQQQGARSTGGQQQQQQQQHQLRPRHGTGGGNQKDRRGEGQHGPLRAPGQSGASHAGVTHANGAQGAAGTADAHRHRRVNRNDDTSAREDGHSGKADHAQHHKHAPSTHHQHPHQPHPQQAPQKEKSEKVAAQGGQKPRAQRNQVRQQQQQLEEPLQHEHQQSQPQQPLRQHQQQPPQQAPQRQQQAPPPVHQQQQQQRQTATPKEPNHPQQQQQLTAQLPAELAYSHSPQYPNQAQQHTQANVQQQLQHAHHSQHQQSQQQQHRQPHNQHQQHTAAPLNKQAAPAVAEAGSAQQYRTQQHGSNVPAQLQTASFHEDPQQRRRAQPQAQQSAQQMQHGAVSMGLGAMPNALGQDSMLLATSIASDMRGMVGGSTGHRPSEMMSADDRQSSAAAGAALATGSGVTRSPYPNPPVTLPGHGSAVLQGDLERSLIQQRPPTGESLRTQQPAVHNPPMTAMPPYPPSPAGGAAAAAAVPPPASQSAGGQLATPAVPLTSTPRESWTHSLPSDQHAPLPAVAGVQSDFQAMASGSPGRNVPPPNTAYNSGAVSQPGENLSNTINSTLPAGGSNEFLRTLNSQHQDPMVPPSGQQHVLANSNSSVASPASAGGEAMLSRSSVAHSVSGNTGIKESAQKLLQAGPGVVQSTQQTRAVPPGLKSDGMSQFQPPSSSWSGPPDGSVNVGSMQHGTVSGTATPAVASSATRTPPVSAPSGAASASPPSLPFSSADSLPSATPAALPAARFPEGNQTQQWQHQQRQQHHQQQQQLQQLQQQQQQHERQQETRYTQHQQQSQHQHHHPQQHHEQHRRQEHKQQHQQQEHKQQHQQLPHQQQHPPQQSDDAHRVGDSAGQESSLLPATSTDKPNLDPKSMHVQPNSNLPPSSFQQQRQQPADNPSKHADGQAENESTSEGSAAVHESDMSSAAAPDYPAAMPSSMYPHPRHYPFPAHQMAMPGPPMFQQPNPYMMPFNWTMPMMPGMVPGMPPPLPPPALPSHAMLPMAERMPVSERSGAATATGGQHGSSAEGQGQATAAAGAADDKPGKPTQSSVENSPKQEEDDEVDRGKTDETIDTNMAPPTLPEVGRGHFGHTKEEQQAFASTSVPTASTPSTAVMPSAVTTPRKLGGNFDQSVLLEVGGRLFPVLASTFMRYPDSLIGRMFSGQATMELNERGAFAFDRDSNLFECLLAFCRTGSFYPPPFYSIAAIQEEAKFFGLSKYIFVPGMSVTSRHPVCFYRDSQHILNTPVTDVKAVHSDHVTFTLQDGDTLLIENIITTSPCHLFLDIYDLDGSKPTTRDFVVYDPYQSEAWRTYRFQSNQRLDFKLVSLENTSVSMKITFRQTYCFPACNQVFSCVQNEE
ncbi:uncharacterized protein LOC135808853 [Sycon ciliatum]|uniref:uncharacterized protein LOC135808853 n=1 Tax=Sycon ciliatum TaxID=27933 RepID=UPI0031F61B27